MNSDLLQCIQKYRNLRNEIDQEIERLEKLHSKHIVCQKKCFDCCVNLSVFPVEFYSIVDELGQSDSNIVFDNDLSCGYLSNGLCSIYPVRPIICRTHGIAIAFLNDEFDPPEYSVSFCPKNFATQEAQSVEFNSDNILNIDIINDRLFEINQEFVGFLDIPDITPFSRVSLSDICLE